MKNEYSIENSKEALQKSRLSGLSQNNTYIQSILNYFTSMDIDNLRLHLQDKYTYEDTTKELFLNQIASVFEAYKYSGDTELLLFEGACNSDGKNCPNCGIKGYRFVGNNSKNYMDFLFETEGDDIKDIFSCEQFKTIVEIEDLGTKAEFDIDLNNQDYGDENCSPF